MSSYSYMRMDAFMYSKHKIEGMHERLRVNVKVALLFNPGGGTLGISWWGCAAGTLEPLTYTRAS